MARLVPAHLSTVMAPLCGPPLHRHGRPCAGHPRLPCVCAPGPKRSRPSFPLANHAFL